ncbi:MAG: TraB/GumN family protein [Prevotellaceae bacterium]|jgi:uncharacterized protein YbaP (TraB family)|nr:TraB/GumN family protein [Prevotellaceae bacterium]
MKKRAKHIAHIGITGILTIFAFSNLNAQNSLLWKIEGNGLEHPSYLLGTIHIYDTTDFKLPTVIFQHLESCNAYAMEINMDESNPSALASRTMIMDGNTLDILMGEEAFDRLMSFPMPAMMGREVVKRIKPIFTTSLIYMEDANHRPQSIDQYLFSYAKAHGKAVFGIETMEEQLDAVDAIPMKDQAEMLKESLMKEDDPRDAIKKLWDTYKSQNFEELEKELEESNPSPLFTHELIEKRNVNMADRISSMMVENGSLFAAIGALHLGDIHKIKGVVSLLQEKGYTLTPIEFTFITE